MALGRHFGPVRRMQARMSVSSRPGAGSTVRIPISRRHTRSRGEESALRLHQSGGAFVSIIELQFLRRTPPNHPYCRRRRSDSVTSCSLAGCQLSVSFSRGASRRFSPCFPLSYWPSGASGGLNALFAGTSPPNALSWSSTSQFPLLQSTRTL